MGWLYCLPLFLHFNMQQARGELDGDREGEGGEHRIDYIYDTQTETVRDRPD